MKTRIIENPVSTEHLTTVEKRATGRLIVGRIINRKKITLKTYLWEPNYVEKYWKMKMNKTSKNGWETAVHHHT